MSTNSYPITSPVEIVGIGGNSGIIYISNGANHVAVNAPPTLSGDVDFTLPAISGTTGQILEKTSATSSTWSNLNLTSAGGTHSLIKTGTGLVLELKGVTIGAGLTLTPGVNDVTISNSSPAINVVYSNGGTGASLVVDGSGPTISSKGFLAGTGISLTNGVNDITVINSSPASSVSLSSAGGTQTLVKTGVSPAFVTRGLTPGTGIVLSSGLNDITVVNSSPASSVTLISAGGTQTLVKTGTGPSLSTRGLTQGSGIALTSGVNDIIIENSIYKQSGINISPVTISSSNVIACGTSNTTQGNNNICSGSNNSITTGTSDAVFNDAIIGGSLNVITGTGFTGTINSAILAGANNNISSGSSNGYSAILAGASNSITGNMSHSTINGGVSNLINVGSRCFIGAGTGNQIIKGGSDLISNSAIIGGNDNIMNGTSFTAAQSCFIGGGSQNVINSGSNNGYCGIIAGASNSIIGNMSHSTINGGVSNLINVGSRCFIGAGTGNQIIKGGSDLISNSAIIGGNDNIMNGTSFTAAQSCFIGGGSNNLITSGGSSGYCSVIGGRNNHINGNINDSIILGSTNGNIVHNNNFMFTSGLALTSVANNAFTVKASGGSRIFSNDSATVGVSLASGGASWAPVCDVNKKENFVLTNNELILLKIDALLIYHYNYIGNPIEQKCIGPTAQDWYAQFPCDCITTAIVDEEGGPVLDIDGNPTFEDIPSKDQLSIEIMDIVGNLLAAVKTLSIRNAALEDRIAILESFH